ncbi:MAG: ABC transporter permease [Gemmatimonadetes bacterium]|nr:ABC transporter permease [Gemmatimonadota bacterium]
MSRLTSTLRLDAQLQARNKVYLIIGVAAFAFPFAFDALLTPDQLQFFMPVLIMYGVSMTTVFLVGVLLLIERSQGTLSVVMVSPLRPAEYLASKLITLTVLALVESAIMAVVAYGLGFSFAWFVLAVVMRASMGVAVGVAVGVRFRSITRFLVPAIGLSLAFDLPNIWYFELWPSPLFYLWPSMPPLLLAKAAFVEVEPLQLVYALLYGALVVGAALIWASRSIDRFVVRGELAA